MIWKWGPARFIRPHSSGPLALNLGGLAYPQPCRRPTDGRYGENPNRMQHYYQYQVVLKPAPDNIQALYLESLARLGINPKQHDIRFIQDDWESPTLGAWGLGWEVRLDGMEITQFTYFQEIGGIELNPITVEITYGTERIAMYLTGEQRLRPRLERSVTYGDIHHETEVQFSPTISKRRCGDAHAFQSYEAECKRLLAQTDQATDAAGLRILHQIIPLFNLLDARGAISVAERTGYIAGSGHWPANVPSGISKSGRRWAIQLIGRSDVRSHHAIDEAAQTDQETADNEETLS